MLLTKIISGLNLRHAIDENKVMNQAALFVIISFLSGSFAQAYVELNTFYMSNSLTTTTTSTQAYTFIEASLGFGIDNDRRYQVGWNYGSFSTSSNAGGTTTTYSSTQMGPRFLFSFNKAKTWSLGLTYNLVTNASVNTGSAVTWSGAAYKIDVGYNFALTESYFLGLRLNYCSANYTSQLSGATNYSATSNSSAIIYPSLYMIYFF